MKEPGSAKWKLALLQLKHAEPKGRDDQKLRGEHVTDRKKDFRKLDLEKLFLKGYYKFDNRIQDDTELEHLIFYTNRYAFSVYPKKQKNFPCSFCRELDVEDLEKHGIVLEDRVLDNSFKDILHLQVPAKGISLEKSDLDKLKNASGLEVFKNVKDNKDEEDLANTMAYCMAISHNMECNKVVKDYHALLKPLFKNNRFQLSSREDLEGLPEKLSNQLLQSLFKFECFNTFPRENDGVQSKIDQLKSKKKQDIKRRFIFDAADTFKSWMEDLIEKEENEITREAMKQLVEDNKAFQDLYNLYTQLYNFDQEEMTREVFHSRRADLYAEGTSFGKHLKERASWNEKWEPFMTKLVLVTGQPGNEELKSTLDSSISHRIVDYDRLKKHVTKHRGEKEEASKWISPLGVLQRSSIMFQGESLSWETASNDPASIFNDVMDELDEDTFLGFFVEHWPELGKQLPEVIEPYLTREFKRLSGSIVDEETFIQYCLEGSEDYQSGNVIYIPAEPGMGKTSFLESLCKKWMKEHSHTWVHLVVLKRNIGKATISFENLFDLDTDFKKRLFKWHCSRVILLLDGLDEVSYGFRTKVLEWIEKNQFGMRQIFVTGRHGTEEEVKQHLTWYSTWHFLPFTSERQEQFLMEWWQKEAKKKKLELDGGKLSVYVKKTTKGCGENTHLSGLIGVPLMTKLVAFAYFKHAVKYCQGGEEVVISESKDIDSLFDDFMEQKWQVFLERHMKTTENVEALDILKAHFYILHEHLGFGAMFGSDIPLECRKPNGPCHTFLNDNNYSSMVLKHGIVKAATNQNGIQTYTFGHRTFSEYFAAKFIVSRKRDKVHASEIKEAYLLMFIKGSDSAQ